MHEERKLEEESAVTSERRAQKAGQASYVMGILEWEEGMGE